MSLRSRTIQAAVFAAICGNAVGARGAVDKLSRVKGGTARETPATEVADPIDGLEAASVTELRTYCANLKKERTVAEKELADRIQAARVADGSSVDASKLPKTAQQVDLRKRPEVKEPKTAVKSSEAQDARKAVADGFVRKATLACLLYATREIQLGRTSKKVPTTKDLVKRCNEGKQVPELSAIDCEEAAPTAPTK
jgi:hypothetical protein